MSDDRTVRQARRAPAADRRAAWGGAGLWIGMAAMAAAGLVPAYLFLSEGGASGVPDLVVRTETAPAPSVKEAAVPVDAGAAMGTSAAAVPAPSREPPPVAILEEPHPPAAPLEAGPAETAPPALLVSAPHHASATPPAPPVAPVAAALPPAPAVVALETPHPLSSPPRKRGSTPELDSRFRGNDENEGASNYSERDLVDEVRGAPLDPVPPPPWSETHRDQIAALPPAAPLAAASPPAPALVAPEIAQPLSSPPRKRGSTAELDSRSRGNDESESASTSSERALVDEVRAAPLGPVRPPPSSETRLEQIAALPRIAAPELPAGAVIECGRLRQEAAAAPRPSAPAGAAAKIAYPAPLLVRPFCRLLAAASVRAHPDDHLLRLETNHADNVFREGDPLLVRVHSQLGALGFLQLFLLDGDGSIVHLMPTPARAAALLPARGSVAVGATKAEARPGDDIFEVAPPFGPNLLVAIASSQPLFGAPRRQVETLETFLSALTARLAELRAQPGVTLEASYLVIETAAR